MADSPCLTVFCSSSRHVPPVYFEAAEEFGRAIAHAGWTLVYGGNAVGPMGRMADAVRAGGGRVVGITPQLFVDKGIADMRCDELIVADSMRHRKELMEQRGDAFVALPGGLGTLEELFEIIVGRQLGYHDKPIALLNTNGYYNPLLSMIRYGIETGFVRNDRNDLYVSSYKAADVMGYLTRMLSSV